MTPEEKAAAEKAAAEKKAADEKAAADKKAADEAAARSRRTSTPEQIEKKRVTAFRLLNEIAEETGEMPEYKGDDDDNKPVTVGDLKRMKRADAQKTALEMAEQIEDPDEKALVISELKETILPSGDPAKDFAKARALAQSEKNRQIASEAARKRAAQTRPSGGGAPIREEDHFEATADELRAAQWVGKKTPADIKAFILKARARKKQ